MAAELLVSIGPYEAAKRIADVTARELSMVCNRHVTLKKLNAAIADAVNAFAAYAGQLGFFGLP